MREIRRPFVVGVQNMKVAVNRTEVDFAIAVSGRSGAVAPKLGTPQSFTGLRIEAIQVGPVGLAENSFPPWSIGDGYLNSMPSVLPDDFGFRSTDVEARDSTHGRTTGISSP